MKVLKEVIATYIEERGKIKIKETPLVRCKECKHNPWDVDQTDYTCIWDDDFADRPQTPDDFCSYGERRTDEL